MVNLIRSREFEASLVLVKQEFDVAKVKDQVLRGFRNAALSSGMRQKEYQEMFKDEDVIISYFINAAKVYSIVAALTCLMQSNRLEITSYLEELGIRDIQMKQWERVLAQYKVPSALIELIRISYSPVSLPDGTLAISLPCELNELNPMDYLFTSYVETLISKVYGSSLSASVRNNTLDLYPLCYQHIAKTEAVAAVYKENTEFIPDRERINNAIKGYIGWLSKGKKGRLFPDARKVMDVCEEKGLVSDDITPEFIKSITERLDYDMFKYHLYTTQTSKDLVSPAIEASVSLLDTDLLFPADCELLMTSGQIHGTMSTVHSIRMVNLQLLNQLEDKESNVIQVDKVIGFRSLDDLKDAPLVIDRALQRYRVSMVTESDMQEWWLETFMEKSSSNHGFTKN
jgi:hypothetical protein